MNRFFTSNIVGTKAYLGEDDAYHLKNVLRAKTGEIFEICNGVDREYTARLTYIDKKTAELELLDDITEAREAKHRYIICQCIPKGSKTDDVVRHATELGMSGFYPVISERINVKNVGEYDKTERLQRIADEAAKQSKRICIPQINKPIDFEKLINNVSPKALKIIAWEEETNTSLHDALFDCSNDVEEVYILVGPEGGLSQTEVQLARENGWISVTLGKRILRTETAPLALLSAIAYHMRDFE